MAKKIKKIKISCEAKDYISIDDLTVFQGELKTISSENMNKLKKVIVKEGFVAPFFVWVNGDVNNLLDGTQRLQALLQLKAEGYIVPELPVAYIHAKNEEDARKKLLYIVSSYGKVTREGLDMYMLDAGLEMEDMAKMMSIDDMSFDDLDKEPELKEETLKPYNKINILLSFPPALFSKIAPLVEKITEIPGVDYEQSSI